MKRFLPFAVLGLTGLVGLLVAEEAGAGRVPATDETGSVKVTAQLERTRLLANTQGETFARIRLEGIDAPAPKDRLPISLTVVIDRSGSMSGAKLKNARVSAVSALEQLNAGDRATVIAFGSTPEVLVDRLDVGDAAAFAAAKERVLALRDSGGTNMVDALDVATRQANKISGPGRTNRMLLLSDGQPDTEAGLDDRITALARKGVLTTTLGVGKDYNEDLMSRLADKGLGNYYFIEHANQMASIFAKELKALAAVVAKEAVVTVALQDGVEVLEVVGYPFSKGDGVAAIQVGDIYAKRAADLLVRLKVPAAAGSRELVEVKVGYHDALKKRPVRTARRLEATFTKDQAAVLASAVPEVVEKAEEVRTARAMEKASQALASGNRAEAKAIVQAQSARVRGYATKVKGTKFAKKAAAFDSALAEMEADVDDTAKDVRVSTKKYKAKARKMKR